MTSSVSEHWKYTSLASIQSVAWGIPERTDVLPEQMADSFRSCGRIVFHNGFFLENLSHLPDGINFAQDVHRDIHTPEEETDSLIGDMNRAHLQDGVILTVAPDSFFDNPLEVVFLAEASTPLRLAPRLEILCRAGSALRVVERHAGVGPTLSAVSIGAEVSSGACLEHVRLQSAGQEACVLSALYLRLAPGARYTGFHYTDGARLSRNQIDAVLEGPGAQMRLEAVSLLRGTQTGDLTTCLRHAGPGASSSQQVRTVLDGQARGIYQGRIEVASGADGTDARQTSRALILSEGPEMDTKPELEILADDVKCTHGAATGSIDPDALFYLRSRGVPEGEARGLLVEGFVSELLADAPGEDVRWDIALRRARWLEKARAQ